MARIIISDDDRVSLITLKNLVDFLGHEPITCINGAEAVKQFKENPADLVILDVKMPVMNGIEACKQIRQLPGGGSVPVIMVSGLDDEEDVIAGLNAGANDYLLKPVKDSHLLAKLKIFLRMSSLHTSDFELAKNHTVFAGRFKIQKVLGYGSHSVVFLAEDISCENRKTALKLFKESSSINEIYDAFAETAQKIKEIDCKFLLKIYDYGRCDNRLYAAMQYAEFGDLSKILKSRTLSQSEALKLGIQISQAIAKIAEKKVVHFDIKPQNIMIDSEKNFILADFGIASPRASTTISLKKDVWGTPAYMPPEYLANDEVYPALSDIYSLGITLYETLSGSNPFYSERAVNSLISQINLNPPPLSSIDDRFDAELSQIISKMLSKNPEDRPTIDVIVTKFNEIADNLKKFGQEDFCLFVHKKVFSNKVATKETPTDISTVITEEPIKFKIPKDFIKPQQTEKQTNKQIITVKAQTPDLTQFLPYFEIPSIPIPDIRKTLKYLIILSVIGVAIFAIAKIYKNFKSSETEHKYVPVSVLKCENCKYTAEIKTSSDREICPKCSSSMWTAYECHNCGNIFPLKLHDKADLKGKGSPYSCPKCKSENTSALQTTEEYLKSKGVNKL